MYEKVHKEFLLSKSFEVRTAAISCFSAILRSNTENETSVDQQKKMNQCRKILFNDFFTSFSVNLRDGFAMNNDQDANDLSIYVQLYTSLFCANYNFRRLNFFELAKIFLAFNLNEEEGKRIFQKISTHLKCSVPQSVINSNDIVDLLSKWIDLSLEMCRVPWFLTGCSSNDDFVTNNYGLILLAALKTNCEVVDDFLESIELPLNVVAMPIIGECLAFLIPSSAGCTIRYEKNIKDMSTKLSGAFTAHDLNEILQNNISNVIIKILQNVIDNQKFLEISGFQMDFVPTFESIKYVDFEKCLSYIKKECSVTSDQKLMTHLCLNKLNHVQQVFMMQKKIIQGTECKELKLISFLHYIILVDQTFEYMNKCKPSNGKSLKEYLSRDIANYFCYMIVNKDNGEKLRILAANSLLNYLYNIIPACSSQFKSQLQLIIPQLVSICKFINSKTESQKLVAKCFEIMNFLVLDQPTLKHEITMLDRFPSTADFDELRNKQLDIKYADGEFILLEEIEHFLEIKNRRIEGLTALYEHLNTKKQEIKYLFDEVKTTVDSKKNSTLHRLIKSLISYVRGNDEERAVEAIKCLGQIGCHSVSTILFSGENDQSNETMYETYSSKIQCQRHICNQVLDKLEVLLTHHNVTIFQVASDACYYLFNSASSVDYKPSPYFNPFIANVRSNENLFYFEPKADKILELKKFIISNNFRQYPLFMKGFCEIMTEYAGDKILVHLIQTQLEFAEMLTPLILNLLLLFNDEGINNEILATLTHYFKESFEMLNYSEKTNEGSIYINKKIIRQMLKLVEIIRIYCQEKKSSKIAVMQNFEYLHIARAAEHCEASFTAIQYCEMWARKRQEKEKILFAESMKDKVLQDVMYHSYSNIGIKEASHVYLNPVNNRAEYLRIHGLNYESLLEVSKDENFENTMKLLNDLGLYHITNKFNEALDPTKRLQQYESLWRLSEWNIVVETDSEIKDDRGLIDYKEEFEKYHYLSLQYCSNNDEVGLRNALYKSRKMILQLINHHILESSNSLYKFLEMSHRLAQIEDFSDVNNI